MTEIANKTQTSPFISLLDPTLHAVHYVQLKNCVLNLLVISEYFTLLNTT